MSERYAMLVNPVARDGRTVERLKSALSGAPDIEARATLLPVSKGDEATKALASLDDAVIPVAVGGDGTYNLVVRSLRALDMGDRPIAVIPLGTGNAFSHGVGIPTVEAAIGAMREPAVRAFDIFETTHPSIPVALVSLSTGGESVFLREMAVHKTWQRLIGAVRGFATGVTRTYRGARVTLDGKEFLSETESFFNVGIYNHRVYAFGHEVLPSNDPSDGVGHSVCCESAPSYMRVLVNGLRENENGDVRVASWTAGSIETPHPVQFDGEAAEPGTFDVRVARNAINVLVP